MEALVFLAAAALVGVVGVAAGLALAPGITRWDERRAREPEATAGAHEAAAAAPGAGYDGLPAGDHEPGDAAAGGGDDVDEGGDRVD